MKLLIVHNRLGLGGIETQILQLLPIMIRCGVEVDVLLIRGIANESIRNQFDEYSNIFCLRKWEALPCFQTTSVSDQYDVIYCTGWRALLHGVRLKQRNNLRATVSFGVYHPREFCIPNSSRYHMFLKRLLRRIPAGNAAFLLREFADEHEAVLGIDYSSSQVLSLGIDLKRYDNLERNACRRRIVGVARIVNFKTYLFHMADVIRALVDSGHDYEFHLYGYGDLESELRSKITGLNLQDRYFIHGRVDYSQLPAIFQGAFMSIGEGASLVEASAAGVPSLLAIESNQEASTYGFFHEQKDFNLGSVDHAKSKTPILSDILRLGGLAENEYQEACERSRQRAGCFSIDKVANGFLEFLSRVMPHDTALTKTELLLDALESAKWALVGSTGFESAPRVRYMRKL